MPTHSRTDPRSTQARFGRTATAPRRRPSVPARPAIPGRRRTPERSPLEKAVQSVKGALPTGKAKSKPKAKAKGRSSAGVSKGKGLAGLAALAGAAGVALSQRDKLSALVKRGGDHDGEGRANQQAGTVPPSSTPPVDQPLGAPAPERGTGI
jgi:hypothetical protein